MSFFEKVKRAVQGFARGDRATRAGDWAPAGDSDPIAYRKHGLIGADISRIDGPLKVQGKATYAAEVRLDRMAYAALRYSTIARGRIENIDTREAESADGVILVMTYRNCPRLKPMPFILTAEKAIAGDNLPIMQDEVIHWNGQPIALVLAETQEQADHAASLLHLRYAREQSVTAFDEAKAAGTETSNFFGEDLSHRRGDAEAALAAAPFKIDRMYRTPRMNQNALELHAATVTWEGDRLVAHDSTRGVSHTAWSYAQAFGIDEKQVQVSTRFVGGNFGGKGMWQHQVLAAAASRLAGRPVRIALSREGVYRIVGGRTCTEQRVAIGADANGRFDALIHTGVVAMGRHNNMPEPFIFPAECLYSARALELEVRTTGVDMVANSFMRAPGESVGSFALESAIDELAVELAMDPIDLRLRNEPNADPTTGLPFSSRNLVEAYRAGAKRFGWRRRKAQHGAYRDGEWVLGMGVASSTYPYYRLGGSAIRITLNQDGRVVLSTAAIEIGTGTTTMLTQLAAERFGLPMNRVVVEYGVSDLPGTIMAGGSQQTAALGAALIAAQRELFRELVRLAGANSPLSGSKPEELTGHEQGVRRVDATERRETYAAILARTERDHISVEGTAAAPAEMTQWSMHSFGAVFCEVRVSATTGEIRVNRLLGSFDCGRIINAKTAASQFRGAMIMGLGLALMEESQFDERTGRIMNASLAEYHVPVQMDVPEIEVIWTDIPDPHTPTGAHGIGEIGIVGVGAAVANAVYNATGKRVRDLPITLDKVL